MSGSGASMSKNLHPGGLEGDRLARLWSRDGRISLQIPWISPQILCRELCCQVACAGHHLLPWGVPVGREAETRHACLRCRANKPSLSRNPASPKSAHRDLGI